MRGSEVCCLAVLYVDGNSSAQQRATARLGCADFFHAAIHTPLYAVLAVMAVIYTTTFFFFGLLWWSILRQVTPT